MKRFYFFIFFINMVLAGCSTSDPFYYKSGISAEVVTCSSHTWLPCLKKASSICGENGYEILDKSSSKVSGFLSYSDYKEMIIVCKTKKNVPPLKHTNEKKSSIESSKNDMKSVGIDSVSPVNVENISATDDIKATIELEKLPNPNDGNLAK